MLNNEVLNEDSKYQEYEKSFYDANGYYQNNYRVNNSKSLVELWIKSLCSFIHHKIYLIENELRTDDYDEHWLKTINEVQMADAESLMKNIENIWKMEEKMVK